MDGLMIPTCGHLPLSFYKKTDRGGREMGGQLLHGPLLHSALSDRKAHRARREMSGQLLQEVKKGWHSTLEWLWM